MQHGMSFLSVNVSGSTLWLLQLLRYVSNHLKIEEESQSFASSFFFLEWREEIFTINFGQDPMWIKVCSEEK